ncbi:MAG TPA: hypothetical protein VN258_02275 [Mobilitalea sp.]|nr:hypothetical protein [Mobilitalea sp.]
MKNKLIALVVISTVIIFSLFITVQYLNTKNFKIETKDIVKVTVQYKMNKVIIEEPEKLQMFFDNINNIDFILNNIAIGSKGWLFWIKCYNSADKLIYDFTIQSDNIIKYNSWFYKAANDSIDLSYFENIFK